MEDLTEEPSQYRLDEMRQKGQVSQSRELTGTIALIGVMIALYFLSGKFFTSYMTLMKEIFTADLVSRLEIDDWKALSEVSGKCGMLVALTFFPIGIAGVILAVISSVAQTGFIITTETLNPDFNRVNPISGFMKIFSLKSLTEGFKSTLKLATIGGAVYLVLKGQLGILPATVSFTAGQLMEYIGSTTTRIFAIVAVVLIGLGAFDYWIQWMRFRKQAMMTKDEAKKELKEREGDPQIKARIRAIQRDTARKRMMKAVPKADVVITNPTHIAIAIIYNPDEAFAPKVVAKGADFLAERIKKIARENGIPTVENKPLARTLYKYVKVGQMIPRSLYQAVAEILAYVYKLKGRKAVPAASAGPGAGSGAGGARPGQGGAGRAGGGQGDAGRAGGGQQRPRPGFQRRERPMPPPGV